MKKTLLFLLFSLTFSLNMIAIPYADRKNIELKKRTVEGNKATRTTNAFAISAYFDSYDSSIWLDLGYSSKVVYASVTNLLTNEVIYSESFSDSENAVLILAGLLNEGEKYRFEIIVGDTVFYGDFSL